MKIEIKKISKLLLIFAVFGIMSCEEDKSLPDGYRLLGSEGNSHFLLLTPGSEGDLIGMRRSGETICTKLHDNKDFCDVYIFNNEAEAQATLPVVKRDALVAIYSLKNGKITLKKTKESGR